MTVLRIPFYDKNIELGKFEEADWECMNNQESVNVDSFDADVSQDDIDKCIDLFPVITFLAGYCVYALVKKLKCSSCKDLLAKKQKKTFQTIIVIFRV